MKKDGKKLDLAFELCETDEQRSELEMRAIGTVNSPIAKKPYLKLRFDIAKSAATNVRARLEEVQNVDPKFPSQLAMLERAQCWKLYEVNSVNRYPVRVYTSVTEPIEGKTYAKYVMISDFNKVEYGVTDQPEEDLVEVKGYWKSKHKKLIRSLAKVEQRGIWYDPAGFVLPLIQEAVAQQHAAKRK